jgi:hypothetical protein
VYAIDRQIVEALVADAQRTDRAGAAPADPAGVQRALLRKSYVVTVRLYALCLRRL